MADSIDTVLRFIADPANALAAINSLTAALQNMASQSASLFAPLTNQSNQATAALNNAAAATRNAAKATGDGAASALAYAQATARLQVAQGNAAGAADTLKTALAGVDKNSIGAIRAQLQLIGVESSLATAAGKAETAMLNEARAVARLQQIAGNTPAAIKTLGDALEKASNKSSLPALRAELQKTYMDTGYANSPLISAIDRISQGLGFLRPILGSTAGTLQSVTAGAGQLAQSLTNVNGNVEKNAASATGFLARIRSINEAIVNFSKDQSGSASATDFFLNLSKLAAGAGDKIRSVFAGIRDSIAGAFSGGSVQTLGLGSVTGEASSLIPALAGVATASEGAAGSLAGMGGASAGLTIALGAVVIAALALVAAIGLIVTVASAAVSGLISIGEAGIKTNAQMETLQLGIATVIGSVADIRNSEGIQLKGIDALNASLPVAADQMRKLRIDSLETSATIADITPAFQAAIGPGLAAGLNIDQIRQNTIKLTQAVTALGLPLDQIKQETRAILSGNINNNTQAAFALDIKRKDVLEAQKQGKFAEFLEEKLSAAAAAGKLVAQTFAAAQSNLKEAGDVFQSVVTEGLFNQLRDKANSILPQIFDKSKTSLISDNFKGIADTLTRVFDTAGGTIGKVIDFVFAGLKNISTFLGQNQETVGAIVETIDQIVTIIGQTIAGVAAITVGAAGGKAEFSSIADILKLVAFTVGLIGDGIKIVAAAAFALGGVIRVAIVAPLELAVTILSGLLSFVPGAGSALKSFSEGLTNARRAATAGLADSAKTLVTSVRDVGVASDRAMKSIDEAAKRAKAGQRAIDGVATKTPGATGATFKPPKRPDEDEKGGAAKARAAAAAELKELQQLEKEKELSIARQQARLKTAFEDRLISEQAYVEASIELDRELLLLKLASLDAEEKAAIRAAKNKEDIEAKKAEFAFKRAQAEQEIELRTEQKRDELRRKIEKAEEDHQKALLQIREIGDKQEVARIRDLESQRIIGFVAAERRIAEIEAASFDRRRAALETERGKLAPGDTIGAQKLNDEIAKLEAERAGAIEEASRRIRVAREREIANEKAFREAILKGENDLTAGQIEAEKQRIEQLSAKATTITGQGNVIDLRAANERAAEALRHEQAQASLLAQETELQAQATTYEQVLEVERQFNARFEEERKRHNQELRDIAKQQSDEQAANDPSSNQSIFGVDGDANPFVAFGQSALAGLGAASAAAANMKTIMTGAFSSIGQGIGNMIQSMILLGNAGPQAFKKLAAGVIAGIASQAIVKAIFELAEGFAALARSLFGDPTAGAEAALHFKAAAIYGTVGAVAGAIGAAVSGGGGAGGGGSESSGAAAFGGKPKTPEDARFTTGNVTGKLGADPDDRFNGVNAFFEKIGAPLQILNGTLVSLKEGVAENTAATETQGAAAQALVTKITSVPFSELLTVAADESPGIFGEATNRAHNDNPELTRQFAGNLRLA